MVSKLMFAFVGVSAAYECRMAACRPAAGGHTSLKPYRAASVTMGPNVAEIMMPALSSTMMLALDNGAPSRENCVFFLGAGPGR